MKKLILLFGIFFATFNVNAQCDSINVSTEILVDTIYPYLYGGVTQTIYVSEFHNSDSTWKEPYYPLVLDSIDATYDFLIQKFESELQNELYTQGFYFEKWRIASTRRKYLQDLIEKLNAKKEE